MPNLSTRARLEADRSIPLERYQQDGYDNRYDYLVGLADDYGVDLDVVVLIAELLGGDEDFDGLVSMVQDQGCV